VEMHPWMLDRAREHDRLAVSFLTASGSFPVSGPRGGSAPAGPFL
jgi:hypothetical protein